MVARSPGGARTKARVLNEQITLRPAHVRKARVAVRDRLAKLGCEAEHTLAVETVVGELLGTVIESGSTGTVELKVEHFPLLTSVRLQCPHDAQLRDDPFGLRERVLERLTVAVGTRRTLDGRAELWAEIPRLHNDTRQPQLH
jgi:hypothetical protein